MLNLEFKACLNPSFTGIWLRGGVQDIRNALGRLLVLTLLLLEFGFGVASEMKTKDLTSLVLTLLLLEFGFGVVLTKNNNSSATKVLTLLLLEFGFGVIGWRMVK